MNELSPAGAILARWKMLGNVDEAVKKEKFVVTAKGFTRKSLTTQLARHNYEIKHNDKNASGTDKSLETLRRFFALWIDAELKGVARLAPETRTRYVGKLMVIKDAAEQVNTQKKALNVIADTVELLSL